MIKRARRRLQRTLAAAIESKPDLEAAVESYATDHLLEKYQRATITLKVAGEMLEARNLELERVRGLAEERFDEILELREAAEAGNDHVAELQEQLDAWIARAQKAEAQLAEWQRPVE